MTTAFSIEQQSIINGSLLGDGNLSKPRGNGNSYFSKCQKSARREYLQWTFDKLGEYSSSLRDHPNKCQGKTYFKSVLLAKALPVFTELRKKWYPDGIKIVPRDLILDPLTIAIWFFDDGSNSVKARSCRFATYSFCKEDCQFLCDQLIGHDIDAYVGERNVIMTRADSYKTIVDLVKPFMLWPFFEHKTRYRDPDFTTTTQEEARHILVLRKTGMKYKDISDQIGRSISVISKVVREHAGVTLAVTNTSGHKNVYWDKSRQKWRVSAKRDGKTIFMGRFSTKEEAIAVATA